MSLTKWHDVAAYDRDAPAAACAPTGFENTMPADLVDGADDLDLLDPPTPRLDAAIDHIWHASMAFAAVFSVVQAALLLTTGA